jgi:hypothetical protein
MFDRYLLFRCRCFSVRTVRKAQVLLFMLSGGGGAFLTFFLAPLYFELNYFQTLFQHCGHREQPRERRGEEHRVHLPRYLKTPKGCLRIQKKIVSETLKKVVLVSNLMLFE